MGKPERCCTLREERDATHSHVRPQPPAALRKGLDAKSVEAAFVKYKADGVEAVQADGVSRLCDDLGVDPGDVALLVLAYHFKAERMCEFSREEWLRGFTALGVDTVPKLAALMDTLRLSLADGETFRGVYAYAFGFGLDRGAKSLVAETAQALWGLLLPGRWVGRPARPRLARARLMPRRHPQACADAWMAFVAELQGLKVVSKDTCAPLCRTGVCCASSDPHPRTGMQLAEFIRTIKPDFSNFDENAAWPTLIDDFVATQRASSAGD
jgi:DCN1-like protein 1/2